MCPSPIQHPIINARLTRARGRHLDWFSEKISSFRWHYYVNDFSATVFFNSWRHKHIIFVHLTILLSSLNKIGSYSGNMEKKNHVYWIIYDQFWIKMYLYSIVNFSKNTRCPSVNSGWKNQCAREKSVKMKHNRRTGLIYR